LQLKKRHLEYRLFSDKKIIPLSSEIKKTGSQVRDTGFAHQIILVKNRTVPAELLDQELREVGLPLAIRTVRSSVWLGLLISAQADYSLAN